MMHKKIWLATAMAGVFLGTLNFDAKADVGFSYRGGWGRAHRGWGGGLNFVIDTRPHFVHLPRYGFSVAEGTPYDMFLYDNRYYIYDNNYWYRSSCYGGPWIVVREESLPDKIRSQRLEDIRRARGMESPGGEARQSRGHHDDINSSHADSPKSNGNEPNESRSSN